MYGKVKGKMHGCQDAGVSVTPGKLRGKMRELTQVLAPPTNPATHLRDKFLL